MAMEIATEAEIRHGLAGNSFLIWEMLDDFINSVKGAYYRMSFWEELRGEEANKELQNVYNTKALGIGRLSSELVKEKESVLIDKVVELWREYHKVKVIEERDYSVDSANFMPLELKLS